MKKMKMLSILIIGISLSFGTQSGQAQSAFNVDEYYQFLADHQDMQSQDLLNAHMPPTTYWSNNETPTDLEVFDYLDSIQIKYELTADELSALQERHFVVSERLSFKSMGDAYIDIFRKDLPVFVSTDAILHALHRSYDEILKNLEIAILEPDLHILLDGMLANYPELLNQYQSNPEMEDALKDVDLYLTMAKSLLEGSPVSPQLISTADLNIYWEAVQDEDFATMPLFTSVSRLLDFSQFTVRGHYAESEELSRYFQSMMWLGRMDFLLTQPPIPLPEEDILRMYIGSVLLNELLDLSGNTNTLDEMDNIIGFMVGESDNLTTGELQDIIAAEDLQSAADLLDGSVYSSFSSAIELSPYSEQRILSSIFIYDPTDEPPPLPVSYRLFGQRFIIDSYIFSKVVFPWISYQDQIIWRPMPNPLDAMFALGNDDAAHLIIDELDTYMYSSSLAGVRYLVDAYDDEFWSQTLYNTWLNSIRALNPPTDDTNLPFFMQTTGWHQQKLNTQLASWSQLRHDNLLYAKQSYTGGGSCYYPYGYVEPYPEFYNQLGNFAEMALNYFTTLEVGEDVNIGGITDYFGIFESIVDTLETLASKELSGTAFNESEIDFLKRVLTSEWQAGESRPEILADGWYMGLFFGNGDSSVASQHTYESDFIVADVHTQPTDEWGNPVGRVLHVGVGEVNLGIYLVDQTHDSSSHRAYVGPAMSYYEHITEGFDRLTDERWTENVESGGVPPRPDWVNVYLTDSEGSQFSPGRELPGVSYTGNQDPIRSQPDAFVLFQSYPNPFNPITTIGYAIPEQASVKLTVFDIRGQEVRTLQDASKLPGTYEIQWNGMDQGGKLVSTGVYFCRLQAGSYSQTIKMVYLR
ncbi:MAG: DUF3160 domain-containing protein [FCB group bacterium]|nr:DUF3160 domain-containing protein [FCB group bacterium]MBL7027943.1 DUF3160 domain-containing protein [Candidatus Neomarinimicrobiota bacterium]MBL7123126.1 DUF3160 domain-containing protein [Candidatus Neomarinimicrobiota bacterium]